MGKEPKVAYGPTMRARTTHTSTMLVSALACLSSLSCGAPASTGGSSTPTSTATPVTKEIAATDRAAAPPVETRGAPSSAWAGRYLSNGAGVAVNEQLRCPSADAWLTVEGGKLKFVINISAVDEAVEAAAPPVVLDVAAPVQADGSFDLVIPLPAETLARLKPHKGKLAQLTAVRAVGKFEDVDTVKGGTGKMGSVLVAGVGLAKGDGTVCGFGLTREDYKLPAADPAARGASGGFNKCRESGAECNGNSNCCSSKCVGSSGHTHCR